MKPGLKARRNNRFRGDKVTRIKKPLTRKERRKQERTARKQRAAHFHTRSKTSLDFSTGSGQNTHKIKKKQQKIDGTDSRTHSVKTCGNDIKEKERFSRKSEKATFSQSAAMVREDKEIARLEKLLKMKKRKKLPASFKDEGLDCIQIPTPHPCLHEHTLLYM